MKTCHLRQMNSTISNRYQGSMAATSFHVCYSIDSCLRDLLASPRLVVASSRMHAMNSPLVDSSNFYCLPTRENIRNQTLAFLLHHNSTLLPHINKYLQRFIESGVIHRFLQQNQITTGVRREMNMTDVAISTRGSYSYIGEFSLTFFLPAFAGYMLGSIAFLVELVVAGVIRRNPSTWTPLWKFFDFLLTAQRNLFTRRSAFS